MNFLEGELGGGRDALAARRKGVPHLLDSIAAAGGAELVGKPVSKLGKAADNKFHYWLKLSESECLDLLEHLKVTPFKCRKHESCDISSASAKKVPQKSNPRPLISTHYQETETSFLTADSDDEASTLPSTQPTSQ